MGICVQNRSQQSRIISYNFTNSTVIHHSDFLRTYMNIALTLLVSGMIKSKARTTNDGSALIHCQTSWTDDCNFETSIYSYENFRFSVVKTFSFQYHEDPEADCIGSNNDGNLRLGMNSHMGDFGDFNADGMVDFVHGDNNACVVF